MPNMRAMYIIFKIFKKKKRNKKITKKKVKITNIRVSKRDVEHRGNTNLFCCDLEC